MSRLIVLDSAPLGLFAISPAEPLALQCERWLRTHIAAGAQIIVPEIVDYELRRELIRLGRIRSLLRLDTLLIDPGVTYLPITTRAIRLAAQLWAEARRAPAQRSQRTPTLGHRSPQAAPPSPRARGEGGWGIRRMSTTPSPLPPSAIIR